MSGTDEMVGNPNKKKHKFLYALPAAVVLVFGIICLAGLIVCGKMFVENQIMFNTAYSQAAATVAGMSASDQETAQFLIEHLERLQEIQKNSTTNDVMSFIYSSLTTLLVGLCAGFAVKSYDNAKKTARSADKAKDNSKAALKSAKRAKKSAEDCEKITQDRRQEFEKEKDNLKAELKTAEDEHKKASAEIRKQIGNIPLMEIHIEILYARAALGSDDKINANERIYKIREKIKGLSVDSDKKLVSQIQAELLRLKTLIEIFEEHADVLSNHGERESRITAAKRYRESVDEAVQHCGTLLKN